MNLIQYIDYILDRVTMYRLVLYYLIAIIVMALGLSAFGLIPYTFLGLLGSTAVLLGISLVTNIVFSKVFDAPTNIESAYITALILVCILPPIQSIHDLPLLGWAAILSMASKYILAIRNKHVFNPAAIAVVLTAFWLNQSATWWVATSAMLPVVIIGGLLMVRKMRRYDLVFSFFVASIVTTSFFAIIQGHDLFNTVDELLIRSPLFFFAFVMLTEPLTSPPTKLLQSLYGGLVGILFAPQVHFGTLYFTPELALVIGNVFSYIVSPKIKERLVLQKSSYISPDIAEFIFKPARPFSYSPGQYMEFTLPHEHSDSRGNRRYFTLSSSPTEPTIDLGIKFYPNGSTFKEHLLTLVPGKTLMTGQLAGDFTMPTDTSKKLVFIAGGIGITPFRSMLKYLTDKREMRKITLLYTNKTPQDIVYKDIFDQAEAVLGTKTVYTCTAAKPGEWNGRVGQITGDMIRAEVPDFAESIFYISGPHAMVSGVETTLQQLGIPHAQIKKDFFPGLT